jgi:hypothetical protein
LLVFNREDEVLVLTQRRERCGKAIDKGLPVAAN